MIMSWEITQIFLEEVATDVDEGKPFDVMYLDLQKHLVRYHMYQHLVRYQQFESPLLETATAFFVIKIATH